jgi:hypothetical protein
VCHSLAASVPPPLPIALKNWQSNYHHFQPLAHQQENYAAKVLH